ncbi:hypothetical protein ONZ45_g8480 [Pleurotus djamor]|nr:hypothetical protein ONZ45_g8480 [Pleurotus djamor]
MFSPTLTGRVKPTPNLETVLLADPTFENTWVFKELGQTPFQARIVKVQFDWDENLVEFLATQRELKVLETSCPDPYRHLYPHDRDEVSGSRSPTPQMLHLPAIPVGSDVQFLPMLEKLETQLHIAQQILAPFPGRTHFPPLKCLQINRLGKAEVSLLSFLPNLRWVHKTIRSLQVELPEAIVSQCMDIITQTTPNIQCIGILALPSTQLHLLTGSLLRLPHLVALEVDVTSWGHHPPQPPAQRALASLFRTFAPTLRTVGFWVNGKRWTWRINKPPAHEAGLNWDGNPEGQVESMPARPVYCQRRTAYECPTLPLVPAVASPLLETYFSARIDASFTAMRRVCEERNQACSATRKLPSEVLAMIFSIVTTFPPPFQLISRSSPRKEIIPWISVTYVCRQWRTAALTTPSLWCDFKYAKGPWLELFLGRSGALPLTIKAFMNTDPLLAIAFDSPNRLGALELSSAAASDLSRLNKPTPYLTSLSLTGNVSIPDDLLGGGHTPSLQSFTMGYGSLIPMKPIWLLNTRRLTLNDAGDYVTYLPTEYRCLHIPHWNSSSLWRCLNHYK